MILWCGIDRIFIYMLQYLQPEGEGAKTSDSRGVTVQQQTAAIAAPKAHGLTAEKPAPRRSDHHHEEFELDSPRRRSSVAVPNRTCSRSQPKKTMRTVSSFRLQSETVTD